nr:hypothetical protein [Citrobacter freundii]
MEPVFEQALVARYGFNQLEMTANGVLPGMIVIGPDNKLYEIKRVISDTMTLQSFTEVIDAKLRYPNTALLHIEFDSSQFNGSIPQISCEPRGRVIRVPDTYYPETRTYSGTWTPSGVDFHTTTTAIKTANYD